MVPKPNLDFLRAFAVTTVVLDHTLLAKGVLHLGSWEVGWIGVFGVYLFFVHTCLVLMWSLSRRPYTSEFYLRRAFRIYPLSILAVLAAILLRAPVAGGAGSWFTTPTYSIAKILANLLLVQNLFSHGAGDIIGVLWSLPLEVQMYILLPPLFFYVREENKLWPLLVGWTLSVLTARALIPVSSGNNFIAVIPDFLPGVIAYVGFKKWDPRLPAWTFVAFLLALLIFFMRDPNARKGWPVCLVLGLSLPLFRQLSLSWITQPCHEIAKYSYGIYLSHPFCIALGIYAFRSHSLAIQLIVELVTIAIVSVAAYHLVEYPMVRAGSRIATRLEMRSEKVLEGISA